MILKRQLPEASELLGEARMGLRQAVLAKWTQPSRYDVIEQSLANASSRISQMETQRFSSRFGEIVLREVHDQSADDLSALIQDTLKTYRVMTQADWEQQSPFIDLSESQKSAVAERITELMLVSMVRSARERAPTGQQIQDVLKQLPEQHGSLSIFTELAKSRSFVTSAHRSQWSPFECYLYGVLATTRTQTRNRCGLLFELSTSGKTRAILVPLPTRLYVPGT